MHGDAASGLTKNGHIVWIASERGNVLLHPLEGGDLVHVSVVAFGFFRMLLAQRGEREESESPQPVVEGDQDDSLLRELAPREVRTGTATEHESPAVDPDHDRQLCSRRGCGWPPDINKEASFRGCGGNPRRTGRKASLCAIRTEPARIALSLPLGGRVGRAPAIGSYRGTG